jgi:hypothetical protein
MGELGVAAVARDGIPVPFDAGRRLLESAGIATRMPWVEAERRLRRNADEMVRLSLQELARDVKASGAVPVFVSLDNVIPAPEVSPRVLKDASEAGFVVFDLLNLWDGREVNALRIAPWDNHPNAAGNRLIADRLYELMLMQESQLKLGLKRQAGHGATSAAASAPR